MEKVLSTNGYKIIRNTKGYRILEHRQVWIDNRGIIPIGFVIHHINKNKKDNRIENLECIKEEKHKHSHLLPNRIRIKYPSGIIKVQKVK